MKQLDELKNWYEKLNESTLSQISHFYSSDIYFKDPFNETEGLDKLTNIYVHMFKSMKDPRFTIKEMFSEGENAFLTWDFSFNVGSKNYSIHGSTHLKYRGDKIVYHRDYWDVGEELIKKVPGLSFLYSVFQKKFQAPQG